MDSSNQIETKAMADEEEAGEFGWQRVIKKKTKYSPYLPASQYSCHRGNVYRLDDFIAHGSHADVFSYTRLERENEDLLHSANNVNSNGFQHPRLGQGKDLYHDIDSDDGESTCSHDSLGSTTFESLNEPPDNRGTAAGPRGGNGGGGGGGGPGPCGPPASPALLAVKVEPRDVRRPTLLYEARVMRRLAAAAAAAAQMPHLVFYHEEPKVSLLAMERLGPSLKDLVEARPNRRFPIPTVCRLGVNLTKAFQSIHENGFIHRSVKPENFCIGRGQHSGQVYIIDFGRARLWRDKQTGKHIPYRSDTWSYGDAAGVFCGPRGNQGAEKSRRDDLEALGLMLAYFLRGELPWERYRDRSSARMARAKLAWPPRRLLPPRPPPAPLAAAAAAAARVTPSPDRTGPRMGSPALSSPEKDIATEDKAEDRQEEWGSESNSSAFSSLRPCKKARYHNDDATSEEEECPGAMGPESSSRYSAHNSITGKGQKYFPIQFSEYLEYCRNGVEFDKEPDYTYLIDLMKTACSEVGEGECNYCWEKKEERL